jgi:hypothetical protein
MTEPMQNYPTPGGPLDSAIRGAMPLGTRVVSASRDSATLRREPKAPNYILHVALSFLTCGLWVPVAVALALIHMGSKETIRLTEHPNGQVQHDVIPDNPLLTKRNVIGGTAALVVALVILGALGAGGSDDVDTKPQTSPFSATEEPEPTEAPATEEPTEEPEPEAPTFSVAQEAALRAAYSYVTTLDFSRAGLLDQLTSEYGEQIDPKTARWAVRALETGDYTLGDETIGVDWDAEAVEAAQSYLDLGLVSSRLDLIDQLTSEYGDQFTMEQAEYAANAVGF